MHDRTVDETANMHTPTSELSTPAPPALSLPALFLRFLRFGAMAWGGPVAQIAMLREQLVDQERWVDGTRFNRVLGVYQALPGPEAAELCIWFGQSARGRAGGLVAGLGFVLPGAVLMFTLTWAYVTAGPFDGRILAALLAMQVAAVALVARGAWKIGARSLPDRAALAIAVLAAVATLLEIHFAIVLVAGGATLEVARRWPRTGLLLMAVLVVCISTIGFPERHEERSAEHAANQGRAELGDVAASGLRAGSLTFGGAYTVIPFLQHDAVDEGRWLTNNQLLQGLALGSVLPAPLIVFATFVGWLAAGPGGALVMTIAIFLPAFAITLAGHSTLERIVDNPRVHDFLDGVMAGVVGLITTTALLLAVSLVQSIQLAVVLAFSVLLLWHWNPSRAIPAAMLGAAAIGAVAG